MKWRQWIWPSTKATVIIVAMLVLGGFGFQGAKSIGKGPFEQATSINFGIYGASVGSQPSSCVNCVIGNISLTYAPMAILYDSLNGYLYVACGQIPGMIAVIDLASDSIVKNITVGDGPWGIALDNKTGNLFVSDWGNEDVSVINGTSNVLVSTIHVGASPEGIAFDSGNGNIYVVNSGQNNVMAINGTDNKVSATIPVGISPIGIAFDDSNGDLYVTDGGPPPGVNVINGMNNTVIGFLRVGETPDGVIYDAKYRNVYVGNDGTDSVSVVDGDTNTVIGSIPLAWNPTWIANGGANGVIYALSFTDWKLGVISNVTLLGMVPIGSSPTDAAYDFNGGNLFVTNCGADNSSDSGACQNPQVSVMPLGNWTLSSVSVSPSSLAIPEGSNDTFNAIPSSPGGGTPIAGMTYSWSLSNGLATLNSTVGPTVRVTAGSTVGVVSLTVSAKLDGKTVNFSASLMLTEGTPPQSPPTFLGLPGYWGYLLLGTVAAVMTMASLSLLLRRWRRAH